MSTRNRFRIHFIRPISELLIWCPVFFLWWIQWKLIATCVRDTSMSWGVIVAISVLFCSSASSSSAVSLCLPLSRNVLWGTRLFAVPAKGRRAEGVGGTMYTRGIVCRFSSFTTRRCRRLSRMMAQIMRVTPNWQWPWGRVGRGTTSRTRVCVANRRVNDEKRAGEREGRGDGRENTRLFILRGGGSINLLEARSD